MSAGLLQPQRLVVCLMELLWLLMLCHFDVQHFCGAHQNDPVFLANQMDAVHFLVQFVVVDFVAVDRRHRLVPANLDLVKLPLDCNCHHRPHAT